jgi:membrane-bound metal-dependent hydrolase YbcI (DUF457 family)
MAAGHQLTGAAAGLLVVPFIPQPNGGHGSALFDIAYVLATTVGSLLPDMDQAGSKASRYFGPISWALSWLLGKASKAVYQATRSDLDKPGCGNGHRTLTHTALWSVFVGLVVFVGLEFTPAHAWAFWAASAITLGHLAHIWGDSLTLHGVPFWAPWSRGGKRWACVWLVPKWARFRAGGHTKKNRLPQFSKYAWINFGEAVITGGLAASVGLLGTMTLLAAGGPWWNTIGMIIK